MAQFPIQYADTGLPAKGPTVAADLDVRTGESELWSAIGGIGGALSDVAADIYKTKTTADVAEGHGHFYKTYADFWRDVELNSVPPEQYGTLWDQYVEKWKADIEALKLTKAASRTLANWEKQAVPGYHIAISKAATAGIIARETSRAEQQMKIRYMEGDTAGGDAIAEGVTTWDPARQEQKKRFWKRNAQDAVINDFLGKKNFTGAREFLERAPYFTTEEADRYRENITHQQAIQQRIEQENVVNLQIEGNLTVEVLDDLTDRGALNKEVGNLLREEIVRPSRPQTSYTDIETALNDIFKRWEGTQHSSVSRSNLIKRRFDVKNLSQDDFVYLWGLIDKYPLRTSNQAADVMRAARQTISAREKLSARDGERLMTSYRAFIDWLDNQKEPDKEAMYSAMRKTLVPAERPVSGPNVIRSLGEALVKELLEPPAPGKTPVIPDRDWYLKNIDKVPMGIKAFEDAGMAPPDWLVELQDKVKVRLPDGRVGTIPRANLDEAIKRGAEVID